MDSIPYSEVRARLAETLKQLEIRDEPIFISRRGQPAGVLMSVTQYQRLQGGPSGFGEALLAWRARHAQVLAAGAEDLAWEDPFANVRDRSIDGGRPAIDFTELLGDESEGAASAKPSGEPAQPGRGKRP